MNELHKFLITSSDLYRLERRIASLRHYLDAVECLTARRYSPERAEVLDRLEGLLHVHNARDLDALERCLPYEQLTALELGVAHAANLLRAAWHPIETEAGRDLE